MDLITYALLKKRITSALSGVKGIDLVGERTIEFVTNDDKKFKITIPTPDLIFVGDTEPPADSEYELWVDTSDQGTTPINRAILSEDIVASIGVGGVSTGTTFKVGDSLEDVIRNILTIKAKPKVTIGINPATTIYDAVEEELTTLTISANVTKGSSDIDRVRFYIDGQIVNTVNEDVAEGGLIKYTHTFDTPQKKTFIVKADAVDKEEQVGQSQTTISFVGKSYYGFVANEITEPEEADIKGLQNFELKIKSALTYSDIPIPQDGMLYRIVYAYPAELGVLKSIVDAYGFPMLDSYDFYTKTVDDIDYYVYITQDGTGADGITHKYS